MQLRIFAAQWLITLLVALASSKVYSQDFDSLCGDSRAVPGQFLLTEIREPRKDFGYALQSLKPSQHKILAQTTKSNQVVTTYLAKLSNAEASQLKANSNLSIEPDCYVKTQSLRDPRWSASLQSPSFQWPTSAPPTSPIIIAVVDTGVELTHEDLQSQLWINSAEATGAPGVDDDQNGCVDDLHGCDFSPAFGGIDGDPRPGAHAGAEHGTHVAGLALAAKNSLGTEGVASFARLMAIKAFPDHSSDGKLSDLLSGVYYAARQGAKIINCSWGLARPPGRAEIEAFQYAISQGALPVVAAGNAGMDARGFSPAALTQVLTVGAINSLGLRSSFSNFSTSLSGSPRMVYAPGGDSLTRGGALDEVLLSTWTGNSYGGLRGTSMATPLVAGVAAWIASLRPDLTPLDWREIIYASADSSHSVRPQLAIDLSLTWRSGFQVPQEQPPEPTQTEAVSSVASPPQTSSCALMHHSMSLNGELTWPQKASQAGSLLLLIPILMAWILRRRF
ncbi:MAG TPA: S8 family serine peptidase [Pseudobdellovibrionaceae bacterium]|nr:S8 family serine peptidase [Pseudobdellovibrionaceae bacterium]